MFWTCLCGTVESRVETAISRLGNAWRRFGFTREMEARDRIRAYRQQFHNTYDKYRDLIRHYHVDLNTFEEVAPNDNFKLFDHYGTYPGIMVLHYIAYSRAIRGLFEPSFSVVESDSIRIARLNLEYAYHRYQRRIASNIAVVASWFKADGDHAIMTRVARCLNVRGFYGFVTWLDD